MLNVDRVNRRIAEIGQDIEDLQTELLSLKDMLWQYEQGDIEKAEQNWEYQYYQVDADEAEQGFYTRTEQGNVAHVLGDADMKQETLDALNEMVDRISNLTEEDLKAIRDKRTDDD